MTSEGYLQLKINDLKDKFEELDSRFNTLNNNVSSKDRLLDSRLDIFNKKIEEFNNLDIKSIRLKLEEELKNEVFKIFENKLRYFEIAPLKVAADIVNFSERGFFQNERDCFAVIFHKKPVANVFAIAIEGEWFVLHRELEKVGD